MTTPRTDQPGPGAATKERRVGDLLGALETAVTETIRDQGELVTVSTGYDETSAVVTVDPDRVADAVTRAVEAEVREVLAAQDQIGKDHLRQEIARLTALLPPCDGGCVHDDGPIEDCSLHGRPVAEVWGMLGEAESDLAESRARLAAVEALADDADDNPTHRNEIFGPTGECEEVETFACVDAADLRRALRGDAPAGTTVTEGTR